VTEILLTDAHGNLVDFLQSGVDSQIVLRYTLPREDKLKNVPVSLALDSSFGTRICVLQTDYVSSNSEELSSPGCITCHIPAFPLAPGNYSLPPFVTANGVIVDWIPGAVTVRVEAADYYGHGKYPDPQDGPMLVHHHWTFDAGAECPLVS